MMLPLDDTTIAHSCARTTAAKRWTVADGCTLTRELVEREELVWELHRGHLLGPGQTRERRTFVAWNLDWTENGDRSELPIIALKWDWPAGVIYAVRSIRCYQPTPTGSTDVVELEDRAAWRMELVATVELDRCRSADVLDRQLEAVLKACVIGASRLPLVSVETPLPQFSFGQLNYTRVGRVDVSDVEFCLHAPHDLFSEPWFAWFHERRFDSTLRRGLNDLIRGLSLSPYTDFVPRFLSDLERFELMGVWSVEERLTVLAEWAITLGRHLAVYDLIAFHHRGANYPDLLLADELWRSLLNKVHYLNLDDSSERSWRWRRGLRALLIIRTKYAGFAVPDHPTSPGENLRVLTAAYPQLPEDQLLTSRARSRTLFDTPFADAEQYQNEFQRTFDDISNPRELCELGTALILDRPLGQRKGRGERDATPLVAHVCFSRSVAGQQIGHLAQAAEALHVRFDERAIREALAALPDVGEPIPPSYGAHIVGTVSLHDAHRAADDFRILRTAANGVAAIFGSYAGGPAWGEVASVARSIVPVAEGWSVRDAAGVERCRFALPDLPRYRHDGPLEYPDHLRVSWPDGPGETVLLAPLR